MRWLVDECTGPSVGRWLRKLGHDVFSVFEQARGISDEVIPKKACEENRIITNDKDFGEMIFRLHRRHHGVVFLRLVDERNVAKIAVLRRLLDLYADQLHDRFVVVTEDRVRFAR